MEINNITKANIIKSHLFLLLFYLYIFSYHNKEINNNLPTKENKNNFSDKKFIIIINTCRSCGLFSFYKKNIRCIYQYLNKGYIPIIDLKSSPNVINGFNTSKSNCWELFFEQPFGYTLDEILNNSNKINYLHNPVCEKTLNDTIFDNEIERDFWHHFANKYLPVKSELINLSKKIMLDLFNNSKNVLGVLARGTDYIYLRPKNHSIPPKISDLIRDVKLMDEKYIYDFIFFSTEDEKIRKKFTKFFSNKVKQIRHKTRIIYNPKKKYLGYNNNIKGNIEYNKIYLLNIIVLSKCLDLITGKYNGATGIFVLSNGFRHTKIYNLGLY